MFNDLSVYDFDWALHKDGTPVASGKFEQVSAAPGKQAALSIAVKDGTCMQNDDCILTVNAKAKSDTDALIKSGAIVAFDQFSLTSPQAQEQVAHGRRYSGIS